MTGTSHPHQEESPKPSESPESPEIPAPPHSSLDALRDSRPLPTLQPLSTLLAENDGRLPDPLLDELTDLYASNAEFFARTGDFPDPYALHRDEVASSLNAELTHPAAEVLLAREPSDPAARVAGAQAPDAPQPPERLTGLAITLTEHPDPIDPYPWIGLLLVHGALHRSGRGSRLATAVEDWLRASGHDGVRLAVLDSNPDAVLFWSVLGYRAIDRRTDHAMGRPCTVLHKDLTTANRDANS